MFVFEIPDLDEHPNIETPVAVEHTASIEVLCVWQLMIALQNC